MKSESSRYRYSVYHTREMGYTVRFIPKGYVPDWMNKDGETLARQGDMDWYFSDIEAAVNKIQELIAEDDKAVPCKVWP